MARNKKEKVNVAKTNRTNRRISGNINSLIDSLQSTVMGSPKREEIDNLNKQFNEIIKQDLGILNDRAEGDITGFLTKLVSNSNKNNAYLSKQIEDIFNMKESQIETFLSEAYKNRILKQADIHEVSTQLYELREAILITRDSITSSDIVDGHMSRTLAFENSGSIENADEYIPIIETAEKNFKLKEKIKNFIVPRTLEYGEYYAYVIPYSKIFEDFMRRKEKCGGHFSINESSIYESCQNKDQLEKEFYEFASTETKKQVKEGKLSKTAVSKELTSVLKNISVSNEDIPLTFLDEGVESVEELISQYGFESGDNSLVVEAKRKNSTNKFETINNIDSGVISDKKISRKRKSEFEEVRDCYVKLIDPMHLIPVKIMDYVIGYYYIHETDVGAISGSLTSPITYNTYEGRKGEPSIMNAISSEIVKSFDKPFLKENMKFKSLIANAINYFDLNERKIKFQYIPKEYIVPFKINEDEEGNGTSIIEPALFYAKLYLMLLLFKMLSIVSYSNDTRVHYIRQSGIDKNITNKIQEIARKMQSRQVNMLDMFSYTSLVNKVANGNDRFVPVGRNGERGLETEILAGQDIPLNTELMEMLKSAYISATGVPAVILNYINEADYAKTLELANTRYQGRIVSNQIDFNASITELYKKILKFSTSIPENAIDQFTFSFASPKYTNYNITADLIGTFSTLSEFVLSLIFTDDEINNPENSEKIRLFKLKLAREKLPGIGIDRCMEIKDTIELENIDSKLKKEALNSGAPEQTDGAANDEGY